MAIERRSVLLLSAILFLVMVGYGVILPALPFLATRLGANAVQMGGLITAWAGAQFLFTPFWGSLSDRIGRKPVLLIGMTGFGIAFLLMVAAQNYWVLFLARAVGGALASGTLPAAQALVTDLAPPGERGPALSTLAAGNGLGFLCGPMVGSLLSPLGPAAPFLAAGLLALAAVPAALLLLNEPARRQQGAAGRAGVGWPAMARALAQPSAVLYGMVLVLALAGSSMFSMLGYLLQDRLGASAVEAGWAFTVQSGAAAAAQFLAVGPSMRRLGEQRTAEAGLILAVAGYTGIALGQSLVAVLLMTLLVGVGQAMVRPSLTALLAEASTLGAGVTMGIQGAFDSLGRMVGPLLAGYAFSLAPGAPFLLSAVLLAGLLALSQRSYPFRAPAMSPRTYQRPRKM